MTRSLSKNSHSETRRFRNRRAQVLVEYLLLMVMAVGLATFMTGKLINREGKTGTYENTGLIIEAWDKILNGIAADVPDCVNPNCAP